MKNLLTLTAALLLAGAALASEKSATGSWQGAIELPNGELGINVQLDAAAQSGTIDIPAQGLKGFALSNVKAEGESVHFEMAGVPGTPTFDGKLSADGETLSGSFTQGPQSLKFSLARSAAAATEPPQETVAEKGMPGEGAEGNWKGTLDLGQVQLRLGLEVGAKDDGALMATLDSIDQGAKMPVDEITFEDRKLSFTIRAINGSYNGTLNADGSAFEGTWNQGRELELTFFRIEEAISLVRPQHPEPPFPYQAEDVTFRNQADDVELAGTLLTPPGEGPFPAVVFVSGSGAQDRDEQLMGHKPFLVIADHLARHGIASLRYDDRGVGGSSGSHMGSTVIDFAEDAAAGVAFLAQQPSIDRGAVGIVGHSEGGLSGPIVATQSEELDFLVLLAPPGEALDKLLVRQTGDALRLSGVSPDLIERVTATQPEDLALVKDESLDREALMAKMRERSEEQLATLSEADLAALGITDDAIEIGIRQTSTPWFRSLMRQDPAVYLEQLELPVLALFGEKDVQVAAQVNAEIFEKTLTKAGNQDFQIEILKDLNHLFQHAETGAVAEYGTIEETFAPHALEQISDWIGKRFGKAAGGAAEGSSH
ncbi:MAG: alpha/beta fold hydrolase [Acidobacteriota bacterium]